jgi:hypothetical protein
LTLVLQHANNLRALLKGLAMTSLVHTDFPTTHAGIARVEAALGAARQLRARFSGARGLVALLLAGAFSALVVVADRVLNSWADGQIVVARIGLWVLLCGAPRLTPGRGTHSSRQRIPGITKLDLQKLRVNPRMRGDQLPMRN